MHKRSFYAANGNASSQHQDRGFVGTNSGLMAAESEAASVTPELRNQAARDWLRIRASNFMASNEDQQRGRGCPLAWSLVCACDLHLALTLGLLLHSHRSLNTSAYVTHVVSHHLIGLFTTVFCAAHSSATATRRTCLCCGERICSSRQELQDLEAQINDRNNSIGRCFDDASADECAGFQDSYQMSACRKQLQEAYITYKGIVYCRVRVSLSCTGKMQHACVQWV